jgi:multidrug efflux pump subunit AcrA (membrane-fusion protein)
MTKRLSMLGVIVAALVFLWFARTPDAVPASTAWTSIERGELVVWSQHEGVVQSRDEQPIYSSLSDRATLTELAPEGLQVQPGDLLAAFDPHAMLRELLGLQEDFILAEAELEALREADLPLQLSELKSKLRDVEASMSAENQFLEDARGLRARDLISEQELNQQQAKVLRAEEDVGALQRRLTLTERYLHPGSLRRAQATLDAARQQVELAREQIDACRIVADRPGVVVYQPLHIDGAYRTIRVGDTVFRNQKFMILADMSNLVVRCEVPESQLSQVNTGNIAQVTPAAFPDVLLKGNVDAIGTMAHSVSGQPAWQKYFTVTIRLDAHDPRLRSGMSARAKVLAAHQLDAVLIPRLLVDWKGGQAHVHKALGDTVETIPIRIGQGNATHFEVLEGLAPDDRVSAP